MIINLIPKRKVLQTTYKTLHFVAGLAMVFNMSMLGTFLTPSTAQAITTYCPASGNPLYMWDRTPSTGWSHGNISGYFEGEYIPVQLALDGLTAGVSTTIRVQHEYIRYGVVGIERLDHVNAPVEPGVTYNADRLNFTMSAPTTIGSNPSSKRYVLTFTPTGTTASLYFDALLGPHAHLYNGSSLHVSLSDCGSKDVPINVNQILYHNLTVSKSDNPDPILINTNTTYTITATSNSKTDGGEKNFTVTDTLPAGMEYVNGSATPTPTSVNGQVITWNFGTVADGTIKTITFQAKGISVGTHTNSVSLTADGATPVTDTEPTTVIGQCELTITKTVNKETAVPGDTLLYTLNFENTGTSNCTGGGVRIDDVMPTGTTYVANSASGSDGSKITNTNDPGSDGTHFGYMSGKFGANNPGFNGTMLSWNAHVLSPNESGTVTFQATVNPIDYCTEKDITNKGKIYSNEFPSGINSNEVTTLVTSPCTYCGDDIKQSPNDAGQYEECDGTDGVGPHQSCTTECTLTNLTYCGDGIKQTPNDAGENEECDGTDGTPDHYTCSAECTLEYIPYCGDGIVNQTSEQCDDGNTVDTDGCNNQCQIQTCDLVITKSVNKQNALPGDTLTYTLEYQNDGSMICTGTGVKIYDPLDARLAYVAGSKAVTIHNDGEGDGYSPTEGSNYNGHGDNLLFNVRRVSPGESGTVTFDVTVNGSFDCGHTVVPNKGKIWSDQTGYIWSNEVTTDIYKACYGSLKVIKYVDTGNATPDQWSFTVGDTTLSPASGDNYVVFNNLYMGEYTATESELAGYHQVSTTCTDVQVNPDEMAVCEFHNAHDTGELTINKALDTDGDEQIDETNPAGWTYDIDPGNQNYAMGTTQTVFTGTYTVYEDQQTNYHSLGWVCTDGTSGTGEQLTVNVTTDNVACTFTNSRDTGDLKIIKQDGNQQRMENVEFDIDGQTYYTDANGEIYVSGVETGDYLATETEPANYSFASVSGVNCTNENPSTATVVKDSTTTCTFTNTRNTTKIYFDKVVLGGGPGVDADWEFTVGGQAGTYNDGDYIVLPTNTGPYAVTEASQYDDLYTLTHAWGACSLDDGSIVLNVGNGESTCYVKNTRNTGSLRIKKFLDKNANGEWESGHPHYEPLLTGWEFTVKQGDQVVGTYTTGSNPGGLSWIVIPNLPTGEYTITETLKSGWTNTTELTQSAIVTTGETTRYFGNFENVDIKVIKYMDTDGSNATTGDRTPEQNWTVQLWKGAVQVGTDQLTGGDGSYTWTDLGPGTYTVKELFDVNEYTAISATEYTFTVSSGTDVTKKFVNFENVDVTVCKYIDVNGDGSIANDPVYTNGWTVYLNRTEATTGENGCYTYENLGPGAYNVSEGSKEGWTQTYPASGDYNFNASSGVDMTYNFGNFKLGFISGYKFNDLNGNSVWNDGEPGIPSWKIMLDNGSVRYTDSNGYYSFTGLAAGTYVVSEKNPYGWTQTYPADPGTHTVNIQSGTIDESNDFGNFDNIDVTVCKYVDANGDGFLTDEQPYMGWNVYLGDNMQVTGENGCYTYANVGPGNYDVTEDTSVAGWVQTYPAEGSYNFDAVSGEDRTFNFGNFETPHLTVIKHVINDNGGTAVASDFTMNVTGTNVSDDSFDGTEAPGVTVDLDAGDYSVDEIELAGYAKTLGADCSGSVLSGDHKTCTITNDDITAHLTLEKFVTNDNGGDSVPADWNLSATGTATPLSDFGYADGDVDAGVYTLSELGPDGYDATDWSCEGGILEGNTITLALGESAYCSISNDDIAPKLKLVKTVTNDDGGTLEVSDFPLFINSGEVTNGEWNTLVANVLYTATETENSGYVASVWTGDCAEDGTITLQPGDEKTCYLTNDDIPGRIDGFKLDMHENPLNGWMICLVPETGEQAQPSDTRGEVPEANCVVTGDGEWEDGYYAFENVPAGTYTLYEMQQYGWTPVDPDTGGYTGVLVELNTTTSRNFMNRLNEFAVDIEKLAPETVVAGGQMTYTLNWAITGNTDVFNAVVTDVLPANTTFVSSPDGTYDEATNTITWDLGTVTPDDSGTVTFIVKTASPLDNGTVIENTGEVCGTGYIVPEGETELFDEKGVTKCDSSTTTTTVESEPILGIEKVNDRPIANPGDTVNYTVSWSVDGNSQATNVTLVDTIPVELTVDTASISDGGAYDASARTITWDLGTRVPHAEGFVTYSGSVASPLADGTTFVNVAKITSTETDPKFWEAQSEVLVQAGPILTIDKVVDATFVNPGGTVTYTVTVANVGNDTAYNVELTDLLPAGFTFVDYATATHTYSLGDMAAGDEITTTYKVAVGTSVTAGNYDNLATASADNHGNISDDATVEVRIPQVLAEEAYPNLQLVKTVDKEFINQGQSVTYTLTVSNTGDASALAVAVNVHVQDVLPAGFTFEDGEVTKVWTLGDIKEGESKTITYTAISDKTILPGTYENLAVAWADNNDRVTDSVDVEVREIIVLGEALPTTGGGFMNILYGFAAILVLAFSAYVLRLTASRGRTE
ncbi:MAG: NEW3 domain-containing protein [Patescibacteria group bacterium]